MLRVTFQQFRCWENLVIEAPIGGITLIKGGSGIGKTTIFQGITWCLYGNLRLVAPNHLEKAKTRVVIEIPYTLNEIPGILVIERQKNPNRLLLTHTSQQRTSDNYEDKVAQSIIDDLFGTYEIWLASCYIGQGCRNSFLTAPNTGKMELLNSIAFHEEDPTTYIERIDTVITETDIDYKTKLARFTSNLEQFNVILAATDVSKALTPEQVAVVSAQITSHEQRRLALQEEKRKQDVNLAMLENLQRQLTAARTTVVQIPQPDANLSDLSMKFGDNLDGPIDAIVTRIMEVIPLLQRRDQLATEVKQYDSMLLPYINLDKTRTYTNIDYQEAVAKEVAFRDNQKLAQILNVLYSDSVIKETIQQHRAILAAQERLKLAHDHNTLQARINMMEMEQVQNMTPLPFPDLTPREITIPDYTKYATTTLANELTELSQRQGALQAHIQHLQKGRDVLQCPQCKGSLRYQNNTLVSAEMAPANLEELSAAQRQLTQVTADITRVNQSIQSMKIAETQERTAYEQALALEQRRLDSLRERTRQLELEKQRREIAAQTRAKQILDLKSELQQLADAVAALPVIDDNIRLLSKSEVDQTHTLIGRLSSIMIVSPPPVSSQQIQSYLAYAELIQKQQTAIAAHAQYLETIPMIFRFELTHMIQGYLDKVRGYGARVKDAAEERLRLQRLQASLDAQIITLRNSIGIDPTAEINNLVTQIADLKQTLVLSERAHTALAYHAQITKEREDVVNTNAVLSDIQTLRQHAVETECRILQQVVDSINASIQGVCGTLFDRDIRIELSLFKTLKTTKNVKPIANFSISYQGGTFDNISQMSGGEGDRASLALTLALNRLSSCPILMLDESLASLDLNMKEAAIRTIRENTNNTVLIIVHDGIEGHFDSVVDCSLFTAGRY